jgi:molybdopterin-guanine dinucleotide biosynthesis protein A
MRVPLSVRPMSTINPGIAGVILAGGQSRRMGGGDKALLDLGGKPMLAHVIARLAGQVQPLAISANGDPVRFRPFGLPVLADAAGDFAGPLAGVLAGLRWARTEGASFVVTVPSDSPFIPLDLVARLTDAVLSAPSRFAVAASGGRVHPVAGLWPIDMAEVIEAALARDERRVQAFVEKAGAAVVSFEDVSIGEARVDPFFNANTPEELQAARDIAAAERAP